jgi:hypothetical protein
MIRKRRMSQDQMINQISNKINNRKESNIMMMKESLNGNSKAAKAVRKKRMKMKRRKKSSKFKRRIRRSKLKRVKVIMKTCGML